uniref:Uncharacterized protein n=1 Tax=Anguilla anguilla TaxID=7936 RepID=A0A0E9QEK0_ANGAN
MPDGIIAKLSLSCSKQNRKMLSHKGQGQHSRAITSLPFC